MGKGLGWIKQKEDSRDFKLSIPVTKGFLDFAPSYDPRSRWQPPYDQGQLGSCTANGGGGIMQWNLIKTQYPWLSTPSRLFIYYNSRALEGTTDSDSGATVRDMLKALAQNGFCPEVEADGTSPDWLYPYTDQGDAYQQKPPDQCYADGRLHCALTYETVPQDTASIRTLLEQDIPVVFGFTVHESFMSDTTAQTGVMPVPGLIDPVAGGHCVIVLGWIDNYNQGDKGITSYAICRNSWGTSWGQAGYFLMPWNEILMDPNTCSDFWAVTKVGFSKAAA